MKTIEIFKDGFQPGRPWRARISLDGKTLDTFGYRRQKNLIQSFTGMEEKGFKIIRRKDLDK